MEYTYKKGDLFDYVGKVIDGKLFFPAHCIASDCRMGAGIAVPIKEKFKLHDMTTVFSAEERRHPT